MKPFNHYEVTINGHQDVDEMPDLEGEASGSNTRRMARAPVATFTAEDPEGDRRLPHGLWPAPTMTWTTSSIENGVLRFKKFPRL